jgi:flagellar motor switch protein FliG
MTNLPPTIRKAAILVSTLDERSADVLFESMGSETAARVRSAVVELDDVSSDEQQQVLAEFLRGGKPAESYDEDGVELDLLGSDRPYSVLRRGEPIPAAAGPFDFLQDVPPSRTATLLARENPQTIAVIVARLDARLAAQLLEHLPASLATDALERLAWLEEPAADVLADIERQLRLALDPFRETQSSAPSLAGLQKLVGAMDDAMRERMLAGLGQRNADLVRRLGYERPEGNVSLVRYRLDRPERSLAPLLRKPAPLVEFEDLVTLGDEALKRVFSAADPQVVLLALTGAPEALVTRIFRGLPHAQAATLRRRLNHPGAIRLADITAAQEQLAAVARRLAEEGAIVLPGSRHFAAAA